MRNPNRLDSLYDTFHKIHKEKFPDLRFGQLMSNFLGWCVSSGRCSDIFFPEDGKWKQWIVEYVEYLKGDKM